MKVSGTSPERMLVKELSSISMKTIPLAPIRALLNNSTLRIPVARAVTRSISRMAPERCFSSSTGPISSTKEKLEIRCSQLLWPST